MGGGAGKQQQYKVDPDPALRQQLGGPTLQQRPGSAGALPSKEPKADDGADRKQQGAALSFRGGASTPPVSPPTLNVATVKCVADFHAKVDDVVDWESISGPAMRHAVPMLLELEGEQKCDAWMWRPMHYAAIYGASEAVEALARAGASVDPRTGGHGLLGKALSRGSFNFSAVIECSLTGPKETVRAVEVNGDCLTVVQQHSRAKKTVDLESCTCVGYSTGQQPNHARRFGFATPLHIAIEFQHVDTIHALLMAGANPNNTWNENRDMPLHTAVAQGNDQAVEALLQAKADPNAEDSWGRVPLVVAAVCAKQPTADVAVLLLDANARQGATDRSGKTAAQLAREAGHSEFANAVEQYDINERADFKAARMAELERQRLEIEERQRREDEERNRLEAIAAEEARRRNAEEEARRNAEDEARRHAELEWQRKIEEEARARAEAEERARLEQEERDREEQERALKEAEREERERERREAAERAFAEAEEKGRRQKEEAEELERRQEEESAQREAEERESQEAEQERLAAEAAEEMARSEDAEMEAQRLAEEEARSAAEERERLEAEERARQEAEENALREEEERLRREEEEASKKRGEGQRELCQRWLVALARVGAAAALSKRREAWHKEFAKVRSDRWDRAIARPPLDATTGRMIASSQRTDLLREGGLIKEANKLEAELRRKNVNLERLHAKWSRMAELSKLTPEEATTIIVKEFGCD